MSVAHRAIILSLIMSLLWPWAAASTCHAATSAKAVQSCCTERCCCESDAPCGCEADDAPAAPQDSAPATPDTARASLELALLASPKFSLDLLAERPLDALRSTSAAPTSPCEGRAILLRACCLRR